MTKFPLYNFLIVILYCVVIDAQPCDDKCFGYVGKALNHVKNKLDRGLAILPPLLYGEIKQMINRLKTIDPNVINLKNVTDMINVSQNILVSEITLDEVENFINLFSLMKRKLQLFETQRNNHENAIRECEDAKVNYTHLRNTLNVINITGSHLAEQLDINLNQYSNITKATLDLKNAVEELRIDDSATAVYLCNLRLQETIQSIIITLTNNENIFRNVSKRLLERLIITSKENRKNIEYIIGLDKSTPTTDIRISNETKDLIDNLRKQLDYFRNKINNFKLDPFIYHIFEEHKKNTDILLNDFETFFKFVFSESNIKTIREELKKAKDILKIIREKKKVAVVLKQVENIAVNLYRSKVCNMIENIDLEDKKFIND